MPDYTACKGEGCEVKQECARFRMEWGEYRQSVFMNSPGKDKNCEHFWDVKSGVPFRLRSADVSNPKEGWVMTREQLEAERDRLAEEHADRYYEGTIEEMGLEWAKRRSAYEILKQDFSSVFTAALDLLMPEVDKLRTENARLREALEFYADPDHWRDTQSGIGACGDWLKPYDLDPDNFKGSHSRCLDYVAGRRAREVLKKGLNEK